MSAPRSTTCNARSPRDGGSTMRHVVLTVGALALLAIEALAFFVAEPTSLDHLTKERRGQESLPPGVVRHQAVQVLRHKVPYVQPDDIQKPE